MYIMNCTKEKYHDYFMYNVFLILGLAIYLIFSIVLHTNTSNYIKAILGILAILFSSTSVNHFKMYLEKNC